MTDKAGYPQAAFGGDTINDDELAKYAATRADDAGRLSRELIAARAELARFKSDRAYIIGCNHGWEAAVESGEAAPAQACRAKPLSDLVRDALIFANWASGEGFSPEDVPAPEDFLMRYSDATGDEDWDTFAEHISAQIAALIPDTEGGA